MIKPVIKKEGEVFVCVRGDIQGEGKTRRLAYKAMWRAYNALYTDKRKKGAP